MVLRRIGLLLVIVGWMALAYGPILPSYAQSSPPTLEEYWQEIEDALRAVRQVRDLPEAERGLVLTRLADQLASITSVTLSDGQVAPVDNTDLMAMLRAESPDAAAIEERLAVLVQSKLAWPHPPTSPDAFDKLAAVLTRREFQPVAEQPPSPLEKWWAWLNRRLLRLFLTPQAAAWTNWGVIVVGGLILAGVAYFFWRNARAHWLREITLAQDKKEPDGLSVPTALQQARRLAAAADYRQAIRYLYLATLLTLDERGVLRYDKTLTNRELVRRVGQAQDPSLAQTLAPVVDMFDRVWYGFAPVDDRSYQSYTEQIEQITHKV